MEYVVASYLEGELGTYSQNRRMIVILDIIYSVSPSDKKRYEMTVDHEFAPGISISSKLMPIFKSPDPTKYSNAEGEWCQDQTFDVPKGPLIFNIELEGRPETMELDADHAALSDLMLFKQEFLKSFNRTLGVW